MSRRAALLTAILSALIFCATGCQNPTGAGATGGGTIPSPPTTSVTATVEQSVYISTTDGRILDAGYLEYLWFKRVVLGIETEFREKAYLQFNISSVPANVTIESANLMVYVSTYEAIGSATVTPLLSAWDRNTIIIATAEPTPGVGVTTSVSKMGWVSFNIKSLVQDWVDGKKANYGIFIQPNGFSGENNLTKFLDYNDPVNYPKIEIKYYD